MRTQLSHERGGHALSLSQSTETPKSSSVQGTKKENAAMRLDDPVQKLIETLGLEIGDETFGGREIIVDKQRWWIGWAEGEVVTVECEDVEFHDRLSMLTDANLRKKKGAQQRIGIGAVDLADRLLNVKEAAALLGTTPGTLYTRISERSIESVKIGRSVRIKLSTIRRLVSSGERHAIARKW